MELGGEEKLVRQLMGYHTLHPTPFTLHPTPYTRHPHPTPYTLHPTPYTLHPARLQYTFTLRTVVVSAATTVRVLVGITIR